MRFWIHQAVTFGIVGAVVGSALLLAFKASEIGSSADGSQAVQVKAPDKDKLIAAN